MALDQVVPDRTNERAAVSLVMHTASYEHGN